MTVKSVTAAKRRDEIDRYPGLLWDYAEKLDRLAEMERRRMARYCNFCGAMTDLGCKLCEREK